MRRALAVAAALVLCACNEAPFAVDVLEAGALERDTGAVLEDARADVAGDVAAPTPDAARDVAGDEEQLDAGAAAPEASGGDGEPPEASGEAGDVPEASAGDGEAGAPCTALAWPLPAPAACAQNYGPPIDAPGRLWLVQTEATPATCRSYELAGVDACERCAETFSCACVGRLLSDAGDPWTRGTTGTGCVDTARGPYFAQ